MLKFLFGSKKQVVSQFPVDETPHDPLPQDIKAVVTPLQLTVEIAIPDLAEAMEFYREQMFPDLLIRDYWNLVIVRATRGKAWLSEDQRPQLRAWMIENKFVLLNKKAPADSEKVLEQLLEVL